MKNPTEREWYVHNTIENGWSRSVLMHLVDGYLCHRQSKVPDNLAHTLPTPVTDLARQLIKNPYSIDFQHIFTAHVGEPSA